MTYNQVEVSPAGVGGLGTEGFQHGLRGHDLLGLEWIRTSLIFRIVRSVRRSGMPVREASQREAEPRDGGSGTGRDTGASAPGSATSHPK